MKGKKLNEYQVNQIKKLYGEKKYNQVQLAEIFGVSQNVISEVVNGKAWNK
jgi:predicted XRE-type DNA-binding protein